jgi:hypothetical protein
MSGCEVDTFLNDRNVLEKSDLWRQDTLTLLNDGGRTLSVHRQDSEKITAIDIRITAHKFCVFNLARLFYGDSEVRVISTQGLPQQAQTLYSKTKVIPMISYTNDECVMNFCHIPARDDILKELPTLSAHGVQEFTPKHILSFPDAIAFYPSFENIFAMMRETIEHPEQLPLMSFDISSLLVPDQNITPHYRSAPHTLS